MKSEIVKSLFLLIGIICSCSLISFGQGSDADGFFRQNHDTLDSRDSHRSFRPKSGIKKIPREPTRQGKILLKPAEADFTKYKQFLDESNTGIAKMFPDAECNLNSLIIDVKDDKCLQAVQMAGNGPYYSFRDKRTRVDQPDIYFADGEFHIVGGLTALGFMVNLGDFPIEPITKDSAELDNIRKYELPQTYSDLQLQKDKFIKGIGFGNDFGASKVPVKLNVTYALRIVYWTDHRYGGEDLDLLLVLRMIRENEDGSVTFLWRELQRKNSPKLKMNK